eukprot:Ihof_evm1s930 gene=Ihof_evmTU1s930
MSLTQGQKVVLAIGAVVLVAGGIYVTMGGAEPKPGRKNGKTTKGLKKEKAKAKQEKKEKIKESSTQNVKVKKEGKQSTTTASSDDVVDASSPVTETADSLKKKGNAAFGAGKYEEAIDLYTQALALNPSPADASKYYANRGACFAKLKQYESVIHDCTEAIKIDPAYVKALHRRAQAYEAVDNLEEAVKDYARGVQMQAPGVDQQNMSVSAEMLLQKIASKKAKITLEEKMGKFPNSGIIKTYLATFKKKVVTETKEELLATAANDVQACYKLGLVLMEEEKYHEALAQFNKAVELDPSFAPAYTEKGTLEHLSGSIPQAIVSIMKAVEIDPTNVEAHVRWANALFFTGEIEQANNVLLKAIKLDPTDTVAYFHTAQAMAQQGNQTKAVEYFTKVIELDSDSYEALNHRGMAYTGMLETEENPLAAQQAIEGAIKNYEAAIRLKPQEPEAYNSYGLLLRLMGKNQDAMENFEKAIEVAPKSATGYTNKGFHLLHVENDKEGAKKLFKKALSVDPTFIEALCNLAIVYLETSVEEAVKCYDQAIALSFFEQ